MEDDTELVPVKPKRKSYYVKKKDLGKPKPPPKRPVGRPKKVTLKSKKGRFKPDFPPIPPNSMTLDQLAEKRHGRHRIRKSDIIYLRVNLD